MITKRFPAFREIVPVYAVVAAFIYLWTLFVILWQVPSWLLSLTPGEILSITAYELVNCLIESLTFLIFLLIVTALLPPRLLKNDFIVRATWLTVGMLGSLVVFFLCLNFISATVYMRQTIWTIATILLSMLLAHLSGRVTWMRNAANWVSDRLLIFLFLFLPLSAISLPVVILRNLF